MVVTTKKRREPKYYVPAYKCKRCKKSTDMWIEQILFKIEKLQKTVKFISEYLNIEDKVDKIE